MAESKSAALTSLATPQALTFGNEQGAHPLVYPPAQALRNDKSFRSALHVFQQRRERMAIQPPHREAAHLRGHPGQDRARLALGREFGEYAGARAAQARIPELPEPFKMHRQRREPLPGQTEPPQPAQDGERGGAIGAAAAESPAYRYVFLDVDFDALLRAGLGLQQPRGAHGELLVLLDSRQRPRELHPGVGARGKAQPVAAIDEPESGLQQMIAVRAPTDDVQEQIQLRRRRIAALPRIQFFHRSTIRRISRSSRDMRSRKGRPSRNSS